MRRLHTALTFGVVAGMACHPGKGVSLSRIDAEVQALERDLIQRTLTSLYPSEEGWLVLPGVSAEDGDPLAPWLASYRVVAEDSLASGAWSRLLHGPPPSEVLEVEGSLMVPQRATPAGFRGMLVRFSVTGVQASALLVDPAGMRWIAWLEAAAPRCGFDRRAALDSLGWSVAGYLLHGGPEPTHPEIPPEAWLYPPVPPPVADPALLWDIAVQSAMPVVGDERVAGPLAPDLILGRRLYAGAPQDLLVNQEPFLLQRRLDQLGAVRRIPLSPTMPVMLPPGAYLWAVGPLEHACVIPVMPDEGGPSPACVGPSVLFYGRPVKAAGGLVIVSDGDSWADAFPGEYGLSPFSAASIQLARHSGERLFPRLGRLLAALPGPENDAAWPTLRCLPPSPWPCWLAQAGAPE